MSIDNQPVSVRDLKSRFEQKDVNTDSQISSKNSTSNVHPNLGRVNSEQVHGSMQITQPQKIQRQRSKSESESKPELKPKSVLSKKGKYGEKLNKPRKSVTFSVDVCEDAGTSSNGVGGTARRDDEDSSSSASPVEIVGDQACMLCHKLGVELGQSYCEKCTYYMSKFAPS